MGKFRLTAFIVIACFLKINCFSQPNNDTMECEWKISCYAESFLTFSSYASSNEKISDFQFNHNRYNSPNINQAHIAVDHESSKFRMQMALQAGTYVKDNYAAEPELLRPIYKFFAGFAVNRRKNMWIDAGVFPSYIGMESIDAFGNPTLTRSLAAENSPYYLTGIRMNHPLGAKSELSYYMLTGWQRIVPVKGNSLPSFGLQWVHHFRNDNRFNFSFYAGSDYPDSLRRMRYFNNFFWQGSSRKWWYSLGVDVGLEQKSRRSAEYNTWWSPVLIARYSFSEKCGAALRIEHYADKSNVIARPANSLPAVTTGYSLNIDYTPFSFLLFRMEWRRLQSTSEIFPIENLYRNTAGYLAFSLSWRFERFL